MKIIEFFKKSLSFIKRKGLVGVAKKIFSFIKHKNTINTISQSPQKNNYLFDNSFLIESLKSYKGTNKLINWIITDKKIGSGEFLTIFKFASGLEKEGFHNKIYIFMPNAFKDSHATDELFKKQFKDLDKRIEIICGTSKMSFSHATIATSWETAYFLKNFSNTISKFYFIQDYEPYNFPLGSNYELAKNTYDFGFRLLVAGEWVSNILNKTIKNQKSLSIFKFSYNKNIFVPKNKYDKKDRILFYSRPPILNKNFELGYLALYELCQKKPNVEVLFVGWDVSAYNIPFKHINIGTVAEEKLNHFFSQSDMCLVLSETNISLLPLEIMASNSVVVSNKGDNTEWLIDETNSILVSNVPSEIAKSLEYYLNHKELLSKIRSNGLKYAQNTSWENEIIKVKNAILKGIEEDEK